MACSGIGELAGAQFIGKVRSRNVGDPMAIDEMEEQLRPFEEGSWRHEHHGHA